MNGSGVQTNTVPFVTPYGIDPQDVPWLRDLIARHAVHLFDVQQLIDLTLSVTVGPNCSLHTAQLKLTSESTPTLVAIKQYHRPADLTAEVHQLLIAPKSQYLNPLLGIVQFRDNGIACLVTPYHPLGNLRRYISEQRENLNAIQQMQIIHDIVSGLEALHQRGIQHMNLHSANILISMQGIAILTDFGRANNRAEVGMPPKPTPEQERARSLAVVFMAPEVLASNSYSSRSEVYALGMVMFELLTGRVAFEKDLNLPGLSNRVMFGKQDEIPPNLKGSPGPAYEALIKECWKLNPGDRPHLLGLKSRLEQLMTENRQKAEALKLQHQATQLHQQHLYQQQQAQYIQSYQPGSVAPPTPPLHDFPQPNPMLRAHSIAVRLAANSAAQVAASKAPETTIITTKVAVTDSVRSRAEFSSSNAPPERVNPTNAQKPVEEWTIGQTTTNSPLQQRDAIPMSTHVSDISTGKLRNKAALPIEQQPTIPTSVASVPETTTAAPIVSTTTQAQISESGFATTVSSTPSNSNTGNEGSRDSAYNIAWPMPPDIDHHALPTAPSLNATTQSTPSQTGSDANIPTTFYMPPPPANIDTDPEFVRQAYVAPSRDPPATTTNSDKSTTVIVIPTNTIGTGASYSQQENISPRSYTSASSRSMSPDSLFNPGRNTIIATSAAEQQHQYDPLSTFFNIHQLPKLLPSNGEERRTIGSASTQVRVVEENDSSSDTYCSATKVQDLRYEKVKSFVATVEPMAAEALPLAPAVPSQYQYQNQSQPQPQPQTPIADVNSKQSRESILIIPAFPEPPSTLHNRRISNVDVRYRQAARQTARSQLQIQGRAESGSSDDSGIKSPTWVTTGASMAPQEAGLGASPTVAGLTTRDSYTPITSAEDVPTGVPSNCIFSAARNGDLIELQEFLNQSLNHSVSNRSSMGMGFSSGTFAQRGDVTVADILDEFEPIERLPALCCAAVARKNKYQALNMVLRAGANVEGKETRGGNTPLHLVCETAPPPVVEPEIVRYKQDKNGSRIQAESAIDMGNIRMSQLSLSDITPKGEGPVKFSGSDSLYDEIEDDSEERLSEALKKVDELDEQEQQALERVQEDSESVCSISTNDSGIRSLSIRNHYSLGGPCYQMKNHILMRGGLEDQIRLLALSGVPIDAPNHRGETPLLLLLRFHDSVTALATLLKLGADPTHMAPFGPGTNPPEVHVDPMTMLSPKDQKRASKALKASRRPSAPILYSAYLQEQPHSPNNDPNHILVMHGGALAHAAYYLRINCLRYLLEYEIECSDPVTIDRAIIACQQSEAARVNSSLVATQKRILQILEMDWKDEPGQRRRARIAERTLNLKRKPERQNVLLEALAVSSQSSASSTLSFSSATRETYLNSPPATPTHHHTYPNAPDGIGALRSVSSDKVSVSLSLIPTTHLYAVEGPSGPEIELISQHGFKIDTSAPRRQPSDQPMPFNLTNGIYPSSANEYGGGVDQLQSTEFNDWRGSGDFKGPRLGQSEDSKGIFKKFRNIAKRS
ncbi:hypothetical protein BGX27_009729 [Mortierella sp. AM989]|nr:hypothetical protein BGX27_009729 [Mortierella sp. AM989]